MRRTQKVVDKLLAELERTGIPLTACSKVGIARSTYYRWRQEDIVFKVQTDEAIQIGRENITDLAESKLVKNIGDGNQRAIEFQLRHNDNRYRYFNQLEFAKVLESKKQEETETSPLQTFIDIIFDTREITILEEYSSKITDEQTRETLVIEGKKAAAIDYLSRLIEAAAKERLKNLTPSDETDDATK